MITKIQFVFHVLIIYRNIYGDRNNETINCLIKPRKICTYCMSFIQYLNTENNSPMNWYMNNNNSIFLLHDYNAMIKHQNP